MLQYSKWDVYYNDPSSEININIFFSLSLSHIPAWLNNRPDVQSSTSGGAGISSACRLYLLVPYLLYSATFSIKALCPPEISGCPHCKPSQPMGPSLRVPVMRTSNPTKISCSQVSAIRLIGPLRHHLVSIRDTFSRQKDEGHKSPPLSMDNEWTMSRSYLSFRNSVEFSFKGL